jgi:hypothetical protein
VHRLEHEPAGYLFPFEAVVRAGLGGALGSVQREVLLLTHAGLLTMEPWMSAISITFSISAMAKGTAGVGSGIDLLVVGHVTFSEVVNAMAPAQRELGREIHPTVCPQEEFRKKLRVGHHFLAPIASERAISEPFQI